MDEKVKKNYNEVFEKSYSLQFSSIIGLCNNYQINYLAFYNIIMYNRLYGFTGHTNPLILVKYWKSVQPAPSPTPTRRNET